VDEGRGKEVRGRREKKGAGVGSETPVSPENEK